MFGNINFVNDTHIHRQAFFYLKECYTSLNHCLYIYRVSGLSCPGAGGCKSAILGGFPGVFVLFGPFRVGEVSFRHSWTTWMKKGYRNLIIKKRSDFRVGSN